MNRVLRKLKQFVSSYNIHMTILAQPRKQYSAQGSLNGGRILTNHEIAGTVALTQIPDNILILQARHMSATDSPSVARVGKKATKYIEVTKNRFRGTLGTMPLLFCERSATLSLTAATHVTEQNSETSEVTTS